MPEWLRGLLKDNPAVGKLNGGKGDLPLPSAIEEALVIAESFKENPRPILVVKQNLYTAQRLYERLSAFLDESECALFGADESLRVESIAASPEMTAMKTETLASLLFHPLQVVVTCPSAYLRHLPLPENFRNGCVKLSVGDELSMNDLKMKLLSGGYQMTSHIDQPLCFAMRGGIVDVWSVNCEQPVRIEFFGDEIDSIRYFDSLTQKTVAEIHEVEIVPASDVLFTEAEVEEAYQEALKLQDPLSSDIESDFTEMKSGMFERRMYPYMALLKKTASIVDYMDHPLIIYSGKEEIDRNIHRMNEETVAYIQEMVQEEKLLPRFSVWHEADRIGKGCKTVNEDPFADNISGIEEVHLPNEVLRLKLQIIKAEEGSSILSVSSKDMERLLETCIEEKIPYTLLTDEGKIKKGINVCAYEMPQGFSLTKENVRVYAGAELFAVHYHKGRYENKFRSAEVIHSSEELTPGDFVVHAQYGVGQYVGIETKDVMNIRRDFLKIVYKGNAELLVPLEQFRLVRKFVSREGVVPKLNKLGSGDWEKTKARLQENVENIAGKLLDLYASRTENIGHAFSKDTELTKKFEADFPYELTPDQAKAVEEVKKDMESDKPMDRLVCGDVGFGKTEIAVRASFKAVSDGKQTAVLCPTTILAEQHYRTFTERYRDYPVTIRVMNRFVTPAEQKKTLKELKEGKVDIVIGTHRLLSKDVEFHDLGLLVIDEEQRFGVEHKERIKEMKTNIDVLALSATPIPRTLQMSLVGIRQLSTLDTPPLNRYSVQTYVVEKDKAFVIDAIQKELARDGQVFYLYNNTEQIYNIARTLQVDLPEARIGIIHGKMNRDDIAVVMKQFIDHEIDVLVCTTIVENGIDIPNANTILIDNAQNFGLSQIYQIKGRVGRSSRIAYAYLLIPPRKSLSETAQKRLQAVKEFATLGSGYKIAMRDLTIRGAGDLLGAEQSGFIDTVGIDMYIEMLEQAIAEKKTGKKTVKKEVKHANVQTTGYIPSSFAPDDYDKLKMYQRVDACESLAALEECRKDAEDEFGRLPNVVSAVFEKKKMDLLMEQAEVDRYRETDNSREITFTEAFSQRVNGVALFELIGKISKDIRLKYTNGKITAMVPKSKNSLQVIMEVMERAKEAVNEN